MRKGLALSLALCLLAPALPVAAGQATSDVRLLVRFADGTSAQDRAAVAAGVRGSIDLELSALHLTRIVVRSDDAGAAAALALSRDARVRSAEVDAPVALQHTPNDSYYQTDPFSGLGQWGIRMVQVDRAWDSARGSPQITVAVIDTGVDPDHPDLRGAIAPGGRTFLTLLSNGCTRGDRDDNSHGTHVAGVIGATGDNATGIAGVAYGVRILALKALDCDGQGLLSDVAQAIVYAADQGARIINVSIGSGSDTSTLRSAVTYAAGRGAIVVSAAGNCGQGGPRCSGVNETSYPAAYPEVLAVSATNTDDSHASFSTQGAYVDIAAPGIRIVSTVPTYANRAGVTGYASFSGTSQATPFVAGVAALVWSRDPSLTGAQVREKLIANADDLGAPGSDPLFGAGRLNARRAIEVTLPSGVRFGASYNLTAIPRSVVAGATFAQPVLFTNTSSFNWTRAGANAMSISYRWVGAGTLLTAAASLPLPSDVPVGQSIVVDVPFVAPSAPGAYTLQVDLVRAGFGAFSTFGAPAGSREVTVAAAAFGATYAPPASAATLFAGFRSTIDVTVTNTGSQTWSSTGTRPVRLSYHWLAADGRVVVWDGERTALPTSLASGASAVVPLAVTPPATPGTYVLRIDLVEEGVAWFSARGIQTRDITFAVRSAYAATYTVTSTIAAILPGGRTVVPVTIRNDGPLPLAATGTNPVRIAVHVADLAGNTVLWDGERTVLAADLAPGASVATTAIVAAPRRGGTYRVRVDLVREGITWFSGQGVATADVVLTVIEDFRASLDAGPLTVSRANPVATVTVRNTGGALWTSDGAVPIRLAAHWYDALGRVLVWDGPRTSLPRPLGPGESATLQIALGPVPASASSLAIDVVADGLRWFGMGSQRPVTLAP